MNHFKRGWKGKSLICCLFCERKNRSMQKPSTLTATLHTQQILTCSLGLILDTHLMFPQQLYSVKFKMKLDFLIWTQDGSLQFIQDTYCHIVYLYRSWHKVRNGNFFPNMLLRWRQVPGGDQWAGSAKYFGQFTVYTKESTTFVFM